MAKVGGTSSTYIMTRTVEIYDKRKEKGNCRDTSYHISNTTTLPLKNIKK